jgi:hypothetical protein
MLVGDTGIEPVTSSVSGINAVLSPRPLSTKTIRGRPLMSPISVAVVTQLVNHRATRTSADVHGRSTRAGLRQQDIGMGLDRTRVVARNRTRPRVAGCGGFPAGEWT